MAPSGVSAVKYASSIFMDGPKAQVPRHFSSRRVNEPSWLVSPSLMPSTASAARLIWFFPRRWQVVPLQTVTTWPDCRLVESTFRNVVMA